MSLQGRLHGWTARRAIEESERERLDYLNSPPPPNDPALFTPTRCRVLRPFCVGGKPVAVDEIVTLPRHDAVSLQAAKRVEIL